MDTVVISPGFKVRLPKHIRDALGLEPGQVLRVMRHGGRVELVPLRPAFDSAALFGESPQHRRQREGRAASSA